MLVYLAAPYSHPDKNVVQERIKQFCAVDAHLSRSGIFTVSPLLKHLVLQHETLPSDWNYWKDYSYELLARCEKMVVIRMDGWKDSVGIKAEIEYCNMTSIPIEFIDPIIA